MTGISIVPVERLELLASRPWPLRASGDRHRRAFCQLQRSKSRLNGRVLMLHQPSGHVFHGAYLETDFASLLAWRHWNFPDAAIKNCFAMGALQASDGAFLLGVMAAHTSNPGYVYFPAGLPDLSDIDGARVDLARNLMREVGEETGLGQADFEAEPGWTAVLDGPRIAQMKLLRARETAADLRRRILANLARAAAGARDIGSYARPILDPMMPRSSRRSSDTLEHP